MAVDTFTIQWIEEYFKDQSEGFVVDVGAGEGGEGHGSLSYGLIQKGWRGLLLEPLPSSFLLLKKLYEGNDKVVIVDAAASSRRGEGIFYPFKGVSTLEKSWADACEERWNHIHYRESITVRLVTLRSLLENHQGQIDLLKVDTEGHDFEVLIGMDWNKDVRVIIVETLDMLLPPVNGLWQPKPEMVDFLAERGFFHQETTKGGNAIFIRRENG